MVLGTHSHGVEVARDAETLDERAHAFRLDIAGPDMVEAVVPRQPLGLVRLHHPDAVSGDPLAVVMDRGRGRGRHHHLRCFDAVDQGLGNGSAAHFAAGHHQVSRRLPDVVRQHAHRRTHHGLGGDVLIGVVAEHVQGAGTDVQHQVACHVTTPFWQA